MFTKRFMPSDGSNGPFPIGFDYSDGKYIKVTVHDAASPTPTQVTFSFVGTKTKEKPFGTSVILSERVPVGKVITIYKDPDLTELPVNWSDGAELSQLNLYKADSGLMDMAQTAYDRASEAIDAFADAQEVIQQVSSILPESVLAVGAQITNARNESVAAATLATETVQTFQSQLQHLVVLDFGEGTGEATFVVEVPGLTLGTAVRLDMVAIPQDSRDVDEYEMDAVICSAFVSSTGNLTIFAKALHGPVHGRYTFALTY